MGGPSIDDAAAGMAGLMGATMLAGVGTAAGMATIRMMERMSDTGGGKTTKKRKRKR